MSWRQVAALDAFAVGYGDPTAPRDEPRRASLRLRNMDVGFLHSAVAGFRNPTYIGLCYQVRGSVGVVCVKFIRGLSWRGRKAKGGLSTSFCGIPVLQ
ncbi:MAG: hypothetical protein GF315_05950 [candidate division Zixibacteria bacterium]|nr:hypothetical protein [candidate division Zixibacteria bacterium]